MASRVHRAREGDAGGVERVLIRAGGRKWSGWVGGCVSGWVGGGSEGCPALC